MSIVALRKLGFHPKSSGLQLNPQLICLRAIGRQSLEALPVGQDLDDYGVFEDYYQQHRGGLQSPAMAEPGWEEGCHDGVSYDMSGISFRTRRSENRQLDVVC